MGEQMSSAVVQFKPKSQEPQEPGAQSFWGSFSLKSQLRTFTMVFALVAIWGIFAWHTEGAFLQPRNISNLLIQMSVTGILSVGMVLVIVTRQIDLSVGSVVCFLGALMAVLNTNHGWNPLSAFAMTAAVGIAVGLFQGYLHAYQRIPAFIVTLGSMMAFRGAAMWILGGSTVPLQESWLLGVGTSYVSPRIGWIITIVAVVITMTKAIQEFRAAKKYGVMASSPIGLLAKTIAICGLMIGFMTVLASYEGIPVPVLLMLGLMLVGHFLATQSAWGRHVYAIGGNPDAAFLSGINTKFSVLLVFGLMGILTTVAGLVATARVGSASPDAGQLLELDAIASCVIGGTSLMGGKGFIPGAILGALVMESLNNGMSMANMEPFWQYIVKGLVLVSAVWVDMLSQDKTR